MKLVSQPRNWPTGRSISVSHSPSALSHAGGWGGGGAGASVNCTDGSAFNASWAAVKRSAAVAACCVLPLLT